MPFAVDSKEVILGKRGKANKQGYKASMLTASPLLLALWVRVTSMLMEVPLPGRSEVTSCWTGICGAHHKGGRNDK